MYDNPVVLVSGAGSGIGAAVGAWLAQEHCAVILMARSHTPLEKLAATLAQRGGNALLVSGDVADPHTCQTAVDQALDHFQRLDAVVNNAGTVEPLGTIDTVDPQAWYRNLMVNLAGPFNVCQAAIPALRRQRGRIINISSGAAQTAIQGASAYCAAKAGLNHFTRLLAAEEPQITSVAIRPGVVDTPMQGYLRNHGPDSMPPETAAFYQQLKKDGRLEPAWVPARSIAWLALAAPPQLSGRFVNYDDPEIATPAQNRLGRRLHLT